MHKKQIKKTWKCYWGREQGWGCQWSTKNMTCSKEKAQGKSDTNEQLLTICNLPKKTNTGVTIVSLKH